MKKKNIPQKITSKLLYCDTTIICGINQNLFDKKYTPYQRAFILRLVVLGGTSAITGRSKQKIWFFQSGGVKSPIPYADQIKQLIDDNYVIVISKNQFGKSVYQLTDDAYGISVIDFSNAELKILERGLN